MLVAEIRIPKIETRQEFFDGLMGTANVIGPFVSRGTRISSRGKALKFVINFEDSNFFRKFSFFAWVEAKKCFYINGAGIGVRIDKTHPKVEDHFNFKQ